MYVTCAGLPDIQPEELKVLYRLHGPEEFGKIITEVDAMYSRWVCASALVTCGPAGLAPPEGWDGSSPCSGNLKNAIRVSKRVKC